MTNGNFMKVESIAECSTGNILQYFWPAFSDNLMKVKSIAECSNGSILQYFWPAFSDNRS